MASLISNDRWWCGGGHLCHRKLSNRESNEACEPPPPPPEWDCFHSDSILFTSFCLVLNFLLPVYFNWMRRTAHSAFFRDQNPNRALNGELFLRVLFSFRRSKDANKFHSRKHFKSSYDGGAFWAFWVNLQPFPRLDLLVFGFKRSKRENWFHKLNAEPLSPTSDEN